MAEEDRELLKKEIVSVFLFGRGSPMSAVAHGSTPSSAIDIDTNSLPPPKTCFGKAQYQMNRFRDFVSQSCCSCCKCVEKMPAIILIIAICLFVALLLALIPAVFILTSAVASESAAQTAERDLTLFRGGFSMPNISSDEFDNDYGLIPSSLILPPNVSICTGFGFSCATAPHIVISNLRRCDGIADCPDHSDEVSCGGCQTAFSCPLSSAAKNNSKLFRCLKSEYLCDGVNQCLDNSDEEKYCNRECDEDELKCQGPSGAQLCLPSSTRCDGIKDCKNGDDEEDCSEQCNRGSKFCRPLNSCIDVRNVCDGIKDCSDGSDEEDCSCTSCSGNGKALCDDGMCIEESMVCDGKEDSENGHDERNCPGSCDVTKASTVQCDDNHLYIESEACNGIHDHCAYKCTDCSKGNSFTCSADRRNGVAKCISMASVCDGTNDCSDGEDEENCSCDGDKELFFKCEGSEKCVNQEARCNGIWDCSDGSDEHECTECSSNAFFCNKDSHCIPSSARCDGNEDCSDGSDEQNCTCEECVGQHLTTFFCASGNCLPRNSVCAPHSLCPNATIEERRYCATLALRTI